MKGIGGFYYVKTADGTYECRARGIFRKEELIPLPGDRVVISVTDGFSKSGQVEEILPRNTVLTRPAVANVNQLAAVFSVRAPLPDCRLIDKLLLSARIRGVDAFLCVNKIDLDKNGEYRQITEGYEKAGYSYVVLSSKTDTGFESLREMLRERTTVFAGQSGVGKSTILNRIMNTWVMKTGEVSGKIDRGRHTTRHAELLELEGGGFVVDTPGFSSFELAGIEPGELEALYHEFDEYRTRCRFKGCSHIREPGCGVKEAVNAGVIDSGRYGRYIELYDILKQRRDCRYD